MSFRPATSGWEAGDATGSFSLHGSPDGREKLGQQPAPPGADPRKNDQPDEENEGGIGERGGAAGARVREAERERWWSLSRRLYLPPKDLGDATIVTLSSGRGRQILAGLTVAWGRSSVRLKAHLVGGATILFAFCGAGLGVCCFYARHYSSQVHAGCAPLPNHLHVVIVRKGRAAGGRLLLARRACCGRGQRRTQGGRARGHTRAKRA